MKINIITFFWSNNLGALIQAYSLKAFIKSICNKKVKFHSYSPDKLIKRERMSQINRKNFKVLHQVFYKKLKLFSWKKKTLKSNYPNQKIIDYEDDLYIYGSDEIWNYQNPFFGYDPFFFGKDNKKKKISYAASVGNLNFNKHNIDENLKNYLKNFDKISVRDKSTQKFLEESIGVKPIIVLDPCFLISLEKNIILDFKQKDYILVYGDHFDKKQINEIRNVSKKNNWKIISVSFYNSWADKNIISINPEELIYYFKNSSLVFTSMFHGVMLSYKYKKQFWISEDPYRTNKLSHFINFLDLSNRYMDNNRNHLLNYKTNENKFSDWLNLSKDFLIKSIY